jgi:hypothetical protein
MTTTGYPWSLKFVFLDINLNGNNIRIRYYHSLRVRVRDDKDRRSSSAILSMTTSDVVPDRHIGCQAVEASSSQSESKY